MADNEDKPTVQTVLDKQINRRQFIKGAAAVGALAGVTYYLGPKLFGTITTASAGPPPTPGATALYTSCHQCDQQCAIIATMHGDVLTKLDGNPLDVKSAGHLCPKGQGGIMEVYNPYRVKKPLVRTNPNKGFDQDPGWKEVEWDEAIATVASKIQEILASDGPRAIAADDYNTVGPFMNALGSPNTYRCGNTCFYNLNGLQLSFMGADFQNAYLQQGITKYVLMLSDTVGTVENPFGRQVAEAKAGGAKIVVLDPRYSESAAKSDVWVPIAPGTDLAALLAIINVVITEDLYDHDYVATYTTGIDELTAFIQQYTPAWAADICGVDASVLQQIGEDFGRAHVAVATMRRGANKQRTGYWKVIHAWGILNALVGSIDQPGTTIMDRSAPLAKLSPPTKPPALYPQAVDGREKLMPTPGGLFDSTLAYAGTQTAFSDALVNGAYPIKFLLCAGANWIHSSPNTARWVDLLQNKFLTVVDYQMTDTAWLADVVLPCSTYLERDELVSANNFAPVPQVQVRQAVVTGLYDTKDDNEIWSLLADRLGISDYLPPTGPDAMDTQLAPIGYTFDKLKDEGLVQLDQPFTPTTKFKTPSGKIEMYSTVLDQAGFDPLPKWDGPSVTPTDDYPLYFISYNISRGYMSMHPWNSWLVEPGDEAVMINAATAAKAGISDGDSVTVTSAYGSLTAKAKLIQGIRPDTVAMLHGRGYRNPYTSPTARVGANENDISRPDTVQGLLDAYQNKKEPLAGPSFRDFTVSIKKA